MSITHPERIGKYAVQRFLKSGGMGSLYLCEDPDVPRLVAIKILGSHLEHADFRERFRREVAVAGGLRHPNIVTVFGVEMHEGSPCLVMEYIPGKTLADVIQRRAPLSLPRKLKILEDICAALTHAHQADVVHRDIKPGNVMIEDSGVVKVLDFGIARTSQSDLTRTGVVLGTLTYMAPEQMKGEAVDRRADLFSLGAVMYELLVYRPAFAGATKDEVAARIMHADPMPLEDVDPEIPRVLSSIALKALQKDPLRRYQDARMLRAALERAARSPEVLAAAHRLPVADEGTRVRVATGSGAPVEAVGTLLRDIPDCLSEASEAITTGEFARAMGLCRDVLEVDPDNVKARTLLARAGARTPSPVARTFKWEPIVAGGAAATAIVAGVMVWQVWPSHVPSPIAAAQIAGAPIELPPVVRTSPADIEFDPVPAAPDLPVPASRPVPKELPSPVDRPLPPFPQTDGTQGAEPPRVEKPPFQLPPPPVTAAPEPPPVHTEEKNTEEEVRPEPLPSLQTVNDRQLIREMLEGYANAMTRRSVVDVARFYPMEDDVRRRLQSQFDGLQSWRIRLADVVVLFAEDDARARVMATMRYEEVVPRNRPGRITMPPLRVTLELSKISGAWTIQKVQ